MNVSDLPMALFTIITQGCVGAFLVLGVVQVVASRRHSNETVDRVTHPVLYAIGPAMVLGLAVSTLHMHYPAHVLHVLVHFQTSNLTREIWFGVGFAGLGFLFALMEWLRWGSFAVRRALAVVTALVGIVFVWVQASVYYAVRTAPAWHRWEVYAFFYATALLLGALAVGCALIVTVRVRSRRSRAAAQDSAASGSAVADEVEASEGSLKVRVRRTVQSINAEETDEEWSLTTRIIQWTAVVTGVVGALVLALYPEYLSSVARLGGAGAEAAEVFSGPLMVARLVLLALVVLMAGFFVYRTAGTAVRENPGLLAWVLVAVFALAVATEFLGRLMHYGALIRVGI